MKMFSYFRRKREEEIENMLHVRFHHLVKDNIKRGESFVPETCRPFEVEDFVKLHESKYIRPVEDKSNGVAVIFYKK